MNGKIKVSIIVSVVVIVCLLMFLLSRKLVNNSYSTEAYVREQAAKEESKALENENEYVKSAKSSFEGLFSDTSDVSGNSTENDSIIYDKELSTVKYSEDTETHPYATEMSYDKNIFPSTSENSYFIPSIVYNPVDLEARCKDYLGEDYDTYKPIFDSIKSNISEYVGNLEHRIDDNWVSEECLKGIELENISEYVGNNYTSKNELFGEFYDEEGNLIIHSFNSNQLLMSEELIGVKTNDILRWYSGLNIHNISQDTSIYLNDDSGMEAVYFFGNKYVVYRLHTLDKDVLLVVDYTTSAFQYGQMSIDYGCIARGYNLYSFSNSNIVDIDGVTCIFTVDSNDDMYDKFGNNVYYLDLEEGNVEW
jgi:hypothetical protein